MPKLRNLHKVLDPAIRDIISASYKTNCPDYTGALINQTRLIRYSLLVVRQRYAEAAEIQKPKPGGHYVRSGPNQTPDDRTR
jgi:hypothetical protein